MEKAKESAVPDGGEADGSRLSVLARAVEDAAGGCPDVAARIIEALVRDIGQSASSRDLRRER